MIVNMVTKAYALQSEWKVLQMIVSCNACVLVYYLQWGKQKCLGSWCGSSLSLCMHLLIAYVGHACDVLLGELAMVHVLTSIYL